MSMRDRRRAGALAVCGVVLAAPGLVWLGAAGNPADYLGAALPPGQALYVLSKLVGLIALSLFWLQCLMALACGAPVLKGFPRASHRVHRNLGLALLAASLLHAGSFFAAACLRTGGPAWELLLPRFSQGHYNRYVSFGLVALWLLVMGALAGWRQRRGGRPWRRVHQVWFIAFVLVFLHGFEIGSESHRGAMRQVFWFIAGSVAVAVLSRVFRTEQDETPLDGVMRGNAHGARNSE